MEPITINFTRGGRDFQATITDKSCTVRDLEPDERFNLNYKFEIAQIIINTGQKATVQVKFTNGLECSTGEIVNANQGSWQFSDDHEDLQDMIDAYGESFMKSCVNGFIKHFMKNNPLYTELESEFSPVFDDDGNVIAENED